jgi:hypothetical protein
MENGVIYMVKYRQLPFVNILIAFVYAQNPNQARDILVSSLPSDKRFLVKSVREIKSTYDVGKAYRTEKAINKDITVNDYLKIKKLNSMIE